MTTVPCDRCSAPLRACEVTHFGDTRPRWVAVELCDCPRAHCPFCGDEMRLQTIYCSNMDCWFFSHAVPIPDVH